MAHDLGVEWTPELELRAEDLVVETYSGGLSPLGIMRVIHVPTGHVAVRKEIGPDASYLEVQAELIEELKRKVSAG